MVLRLLQWVVKQEWLLRLFGRFFGPFNPFLASYRRDPHSVFRRMREEAPLYRSRVFQAYVASRYEDVQGVLRSPSFSSDRTQTEIFKATAKRTRQFPEFHAMIERNLLMLEGSEHRRLRGLVGKAFTPRRVRELQPRIEALVEELLDDMEKSEEVELIRDFAHPLPIYVILEMLGLPSQDRHRFAEWSKHLVQLLDPLQAEGGDAGMRTAIEELNAYLRPILADRRREPQDDLLSAMLQAEEGGERLDEKDLLALVSLIMVAGHETTTSLIGNAVIELLRNPGERKRLTEDPGLIETAVDEFIRYAGPVLLTDRVAVEDTRVAGQKIARGEIVICLLGAANRDPDRFEDAERLDLGRQENHHLGFGHGSHFCLGAQLARLETRIALDRLLRRFPDFTGPTEPEGWSRSMILRGPLRLGVSLAGQRS